VNKALLRPFAAIVQTHFALANRFDQILFITGHRSPPLRPLDFPLRIRRDVQVGPWSGAIKQEGDDEDDSNNQPKHSAFHNDPFLC